MDRYEHITSYLHRRSNQGSDNIILNTHQGIPENVGLPIMQCFPDQFTITSHHILTLKRLMPTSLLCDQLQGWNSPQDTGLKSHRANMAYIAVRILNLQKDIDSRNIRFFSETRAPMSAISIFLFSFTPARFIWEKRSSARSWFPRAAVVDITVVYSWTFSVCAMVCSLEYALSNHVS